MAKRHGLEVINAVFDAENARCVAGFIDVSRSSSVVNADDSLEQRNFTVAHELGHFLLDH